MNELNRLNRENNELDKQLDGAYESVMTDMVCYLRGADISDYYVEAVRRDLLSMFLAAKERGEDVQTLIGGDFRQFCDSILENVPHKTRRQRMAELLSIVLNCFGILVGIHLLISQVGDLLIFALKKGPQPSLSVPVSLGDLIFFVAITVFSIFFVQHICKTALAQKRPSSKKANVISFLLLWAFLAAVLCCKLFLKDYVLFSIPFLVGMALVAASLLLSKLLSRADNCL